MISGVVWINTSKASRTVTSWDLQEETVLLMPVANRPIMLLVAAVHYYIVGLLFLKKYNMFNSHNAYVP